ncbi:MAG TPA: PKD domain-containing protein [Flavobacteriales bacterium]|nr:PKD domain-containing protein [Flavobacteriales bacterium]
MKKPFNQAISTIALSISILTSAFTYANIDTIVVSSFSFTPSTVTIVSGDSVYFSGASPLHPVAQDGSAWVPFTVSTMISSEIATPGSYPFYCQNHGGPGGTGMSGVITVQAPITVFINEIHYDNDGTDTNEGIEIAGPAGTDLSCYELLFYNGADSLQDPSLTLTGTIPDQMCGYGTVWFAKTAIQNGPRDAVGLLNTCNSTVIQFLSWEGEMQALDGPAMGMTSVDIGVSEPGCVGHSLQLIGTGTEYPDFTWNGASTGSPDFVNIGQNFCLNNSILYFATPKMKVLEDVGVVSVEVAIVNPSAIDTVTVEVAYTSGSATPGSDFIAFSTQTLFFPPSSTTSQLATLTITDDSNPLEVPESVGLLLQNETNAGMLAFDSMQTVIIIDNDYLNGPCENLFFSEYIEGSSSNKALEIYNPRADTVNLSSYEVRTYSNGATCNTYSLALSGLLAPGNVYVISNASASLAAIIAESDITSNVTFYGGDDAVGLYQNGALIDVVGEIGVDPGSNWPVGTGFTSNNTLVRKDSITGGTTDWNIGATQWDVYVSDESTHIGAHTMIPCPTVTANFAAPGMGCEGDSVCFSDLSTTSGSTIVQWLWDFDDATTDTVQNPCHIFSAPAIYTVSLLVIDNNGDSSTTSLPLTVQAAPVVDAGLSQVVCAATACVPLTGTVTGGSSTGVWTTTGSGTFSPSDTDLAACYMVSAADTAAGLVYIMLTSTNNGVCIPVIDTVTITLYSPPSINTTSIVIDSSTCGNNDGNITGITASGGMGPLTYDWVNGSSSSVGSTADLTLVISDSYTLTVTDSTGCSSSVGPYIIADLGTPAAPSASSPAPYCAGATIADLTATGSGGTLYWSSNMGMTDTLGTGSPFASGATSTDTFYVAELGACLGPATMVVITVNSAFVLTASSDDSICTGDSTTVSVTGLGGMTPYTFTWDNGLGVGSAFSVTPSTATTYGVSGVDSMGCASNNDSVTITVLPPLTINAFGTAVICAGDVATLSVTVSGGNGGPYQYSWSSGQTTSSIIVTPTSTTTYTVSVSDLCSPVAMDATTVTVHPMPTADFSSTTTMLTADFTGLSIGAIVSRAWSFGDGNTSTLQNPSNTYATAGTYLVCLTVTSDSGCVDSACSNVVVTSVGIAERGFGAQLNIYPNPNNSGLFYLQLANLPNESYTLSVYNAIGKELMQSEHEANQLPKALNLKSYGPGIYYLRLTNKSNNNNINRKIIFIK